MDVGNIDPAKWADALLYLIVGILGAFGLGHARKRKPDPSTEMIEVAGAIVSDKAVDRMVTALDGFTASAKVLTLAIDKDVEAKGKLTSALARNADAAEEVHDEIKDVAVKLDRLKDELIRTQAAGGR